MSDSSSNAALDDLLAKQAITEVLHRYCRGVDRRDWELVRDCYHADCFDDHAIFKGDRDEFVEWVSGFLAGFSATMHTISNVLITLDGDQAGSESYVRAWHRFEPETADAPPRDLIAGARYVDRFERRDGEWRLSQRTVVMDWAKVETITESFDLPADAVFSRTDPDDLSYSVLRAARGVA